MNTTKYLFCIFLGAIFTISLALPVAAQSIWSAKTSYGSQAGIDLQIPDFDFIEADAPTSVLYLYSHLALNDTYTLKVELPLSHFEASFFGTGISETSVGNPYLGIRIKNLESSWGFDTGIRLPLAPSDNFGGILTGILIENYNISPFIPESFAFSAETDYTYSNNSGLLVKAGGGPELIASNNLDDAEVFIRYYGQVFYVERFFRFGAGLTGQAIITEGDISFADASIHNFGILGSYDFGRATLGSFLKFPLDDGLNDLVTLVIGLNATIAL